MKDWSYYRNAEVPYHGYDYQKEYRDSLVRSINDTPMTAVDRKLALNKVSDQVREHMREVNQQYNEAVRAKIEEFWADAQAELAYNFYLDEEGVALLQSKAYEAGHSGGFASIFAELEDLVDFAQQILQSAARKDRLR